MLTLGVDFAAQPKDTAAAVIRWHSRSAVVERLELRVDDARIRALAATVDKVGIDVPFGWPDAFVRAVDAYHDGARWPGRA